MTPWSVFLFVIPGISCVSWALTNFPMAKIEISQVAEILTKHKIDPSVLREIVEELRHTRTSERAGRAQDQESEDAFEKLRRDGYM